MTASPASWVLLARIVRPQGRRGEVLAEIFTDFPQYFHQRKQLFLRPPTGRQGDAMRQAKVESIVIKSISGHQTDRMRELYSTVAPDEQRQSIRNVVNLFGPRQSGEGSGEGAPVSGEGKQKARGE